MPRTMYRAERCFVIPVARYTVKIGDIGRKDGKCIPWIACENWMRSKVAVFVEILTGSQYWQDR